MIQLAPELAASEAIAVDAIEPSPNNPRVIRLDDPELLSLADSIRAQGVIQPIVVRPLGPSAYQLLAGERRWRASKLAGRNLIPVVVRRDLTENQAIEITVIENLQRQDLSPLEEARGVAALLSTGQEYEQIADRLGKSPRWVARRAHLVHLSTLWREALEDPTSRAYGMSAAALELVARLPEPAQATLLTRWGQWSTMRLSQIRHAIATITQTLSAAPWPLAAPDLPGGACSACPKRSSCNPTLWDAEDLADANSYGSDPTPDVDTDRCLDADCWSAKADAWVHLRATEMEQPVLLAGYGIKAPAGLPGTLYHEHDVQVLHNPAPGALEALRISGPHMGTTVWLKPHQGAKAKAAPGTRSAGELLTEKREQLGHRRAKRVLELVAQHVTAMDCPSLDTVLLLAAAHGTSHRRDSAGCLGHWEDYKNRITSSAHLLELAADNPLASLWESVRAVLVNLVLSATKLDKIEQCTTIGLPAVAALEAHLGYALEDLLALATADLGEPKSWAKLAAQADLERDAVEVAQPAAPKRGRRKS